MFADEREESMIDSRREIEGTSVAILTELNSDSPMNLRSRKDDPDVSGIKDALEHKEGILTAESGISASSKSRILSWDRLVNLRHRKVRSADAELFFEYPEGMIWQEVDFEFPLYKFRDFQGDPESYIWNGAWESPKENLGSLELIKEELLSRVGRKVEQTVLDSEKQKYRTVADNLDDLAEIRDIVLEDDHVSGSLLDTIGKNRDEFWTDSSSQVIDNFLEAEYYRENPYEVLENEGAFAVGGGPSLAEFVLEDYFTSVWEYQGNLMGYDPNAGDSGKVVNLIDSETLRTEMNIDAEKVEERVNNIGKDQNPSMDQMLEDTGQVMEEKYDSRDDYLADAIDSMRSPEIDYEKRDHFVREILRDRIDEIERPETMEKANKLFYGHLYQRHSDST